MDLPLPAKRDHKQCEIKLLVIQLTTFTLRDLVPFKVHSEHLVG